MIYVTRIFNPVLRCVLLLLAVAVSSAALAQQTISGHVLHADNSAVHNASVELLNSNLATATDNQGHFILSEVPAGTYMIRVSALGYAAENHTVLVDGSVTLDFQLTAVENRLDEAVVTAQKM